MYRAYSLRDSSAIQISKHIENGSAYVSLDKLPLGTILILTGILNLYLECSIILQTIFSATR